jgi:hypothetical protein
MKLRQLIICVLLSVSNTLLADVQDRLPDLAKALRGGKLIHKTDPKIMMGFKYEYGADLNFEELKKKLKEFLGDGWEEKEVDPRVIIGIKQGMKKASGIDIAEYSIFVNPAFPEHEINLTMMREKNEEKEWCIVDISGRWNKTAEQAAP